MKVLFVADLHIGLNNDSIIVGKTNSRMVEIENNLNQIVKFEIDNHNIDLVVIGGDVFETSNPTPDEEALFCRFIRKLLDKKVLVVNVVGNHDFSTYRSHALSPVSEILTKDPNYTLVEKPFVFYDMLFLPHIDHDDRNEYPNMIQSLISSGKVTSGVGFGHFHVNGGTIGYERNLLANGEHTLSGNHINGLKSLFMGHLHSPQRFMAGNTTCAYSGSIVKNDISENGDAKGFLVFDHHNPENVEFVHFKHTVDYFSLEVKESEIKDVDFGIFDRKIVSMHVTDYKGEYSRSDLDSLIKKGNPHMIRQIKLDYDRQETKLKSSINPDFSLSASFSDMVGSYFNNHKHKDELVKKSHDLYQSMRNKK